MTVEFRNQYFEACVRDVDFFARGDPEYVFDRISKLIKRRK